MEIPERVRHLAHLPPLRHLPGPALLELARVVVPRILEAGTVVFEEGSADQYKHETDSAEDPDALRYGLALSLEGTRAFGSYAAGLGTSLSFLVKPNSGEGLAQLGLLVWPDALQRGHGYLRDDWEVFVAVALDVKLRYLTEIDFAVGGAATVSITPRDVFTALVRERAEAVVFAHNHPSGDPTPSAADLELTAKLRKVGELVGVRVVDHVIVAQGERFSFAESLWKPQT